MIRLFVLAGYLGLALASECIDDHFNPDPAFPKNVADKSRNQQDADVEVPHRLQIWPDGKFHSHVLATTLEEFFGLDADLIDRNEMTLKDFLKKMIVQHDKDDNDEMKLDKTSPRYIVAQVSATELAAVAANWDKMPNYLFDQRSLGFQENGEEQYSVTSFQLSSKYPYVSEAARRIRYSTVAGQLSTYLANQDQAAAACDFLKSDIVGNHQTGLAVNWKATVMYKETTNQWIRLQVMGGILIAISAMCIFLLVHFGYSQADGASATKYAAMQWVKAGDVTFQIVMCLGCMLMGINMCFLTSRKSSAVCNAFQFTAHGSLLLVFGAFSGRTYKLNEVMEIIRQQTVQDRKFKYRYIISFGPLLLSFTYLAIMVALYPLEPGWKMDSEFPKFYRECNQYEIKMVWFTVVPFLIDIIYGGYLIVTNLGLKDLQDQYNEYAQIMGLLFLGVLVIAFSSLINIIEMNPYTKDASVLGIVACWFYSVILVMILPRFWKAWRSGAPPKGFVKESDRKKPSTEMA